MTVSHPALADFLDRRRESITAEWLVRVRGDQEIPSADDLPREQLIDHVPFLLDGLIHGLRGTPHATAETTRQSQVHGETRAQQNYSLPELLREVSILRNVLIEAWVEFDVATGPERRSQLETSGILHAILDAVIAESTAGFVSRQQEEILAANQALEEAHAQSEALNVQLVDLDERRLRMLRTITHEIANHLNAAGLMTNFLSRSSTVGDPDTQESLASITRSIDAMNVLMKQLLEFSLLAAAAEKITIELLSPFALFDELVMIARSSATEKGLGFTGEIAPELGPVNTDGNLLRRVGLNLLTNAIKYTATGRVTLSFLPYDEQNWALEVSDTGCGIAGEDQARIFDEFFRSKTPFEAPPGVGLGLSITKQLVALLRGRIELESAVGVGSTFRVILPKV